ncbi:MAG: hypothetical protein VX777_10735 [Chlamydiota bacterium]|nr:hypothetical protein [Chlamydiota bacterium]
MIILITFTSGCQTAEDKQDDVKTVMIAGRTNTGPIYQIKVPVSWTQIPPTASDPLLDTKVPIYSFFFQSGEDAATVTIHNFPSNNIADRIPPMAQVIRWKEQFKDINETELSITPQSFGGYAGYRFEGAGSTEGGSSSVIAWAMQLPPEHYHSLNFPLKDSSAEVRNQMKADYTIKIVGSYKMLMEHKNTIDKAARSFRLIKEIPKDL